VNYISMSNSTNLSQAASSTGSYFSANMQVLLYIHHYAPINVMPPGGRPGYRWGLDFLKKILS
jgi:hypothetical protein